MKRKKGHTATFKLDRYKFMKRKKGHTATFSIGYTTPTDVLQPLIISALNKLFWAVYD